MPCSDEDNDRDPSTLEEKVFGGKYADVTLLAGDQEFKVHKNILSERSQFFDAMFHTDMLEKNQERVELKDINPEVVKEMLIFIYRDKIYKYDLVPDLLMAADKVHV